MRSLVTLSLVGLVAQLIDGSLGMAYGATSASLLLAVGLSPVTASASIHLAEVGTTLASGVSHWRFGNVHWPTVWRLGVPGAVGALVGTQILIGLSTELARPVTSGILLVIGVHLLLRFSRRSLVATTVHPLRARFLVPLGLVAGLVDATGGGGWGPVATPSLLVTDRMPPRFVIGTVDTSEFLVASAASIGFVVALGSAVLDPVVVAGLLLGGLVAAPLAAWFVRHLHPRMLGASVGGLLVVTNARTLLLSTGVSGPVRLQVLLALVVVWAVAVAVAWRDRDASTEQRVATDEGLSEGDAPGHAIVDESVG